MHALLTSLFEALVYLPGWYRGRAFVERGWRVGVLYLSLGGAIEAERAEEGHPMAGDPSILAIPITTQPKVQSTYRFLSSALADAS